eukprot:CAMPEP_0196746352 /NCGR_PEP_ID=MMETSP1091-20130531/65428_1 /TAXON_ID=302021 /ORGANISM="Rhodomonas sp., Strain CCMP768" /LENGTH=428 /DNA_ID=CAMNT_0042093307 /DNA_START=256 /DNA_END=1542 /DNA_ORIENTATION=+
MEAEATFDVQDHEELEAALERNKPQVQAPSNQVTLASPIKSESLLSLPAGSEDGDTNGDAGFIEPPTLQNGGMGKVPPPQKSSNEAPLPSLAGHLPLRDFLLSGAGEAVWGAGHLVVANSATAHAKFGGGGSSDVPTITSKTEAQKTGCTYWEVRFDRKGPGVVKIGVAHFLPSEEEQAASYRKMHGAQIGQNWNDRKCVGCTWYLDSGGEVYDGNSCLYEASSGGFSSNDVVGVQIVEGKLSFTVNGVGLDSEFATVTKWPVCLGVLLSLKNDKVTLVGEGGKTQEEYDKWKRAEEERLRWQEMERANQERRAKAERERAERRSTPRAAPPEEVVTSPQAEPRGVMDAHEGGSAARNSNDQGGGDGDDDAAKRDEESSERQAEGANGWEGMRGEGFQTVPVIPPPAFETALASTLEPQHAPSYDPGP